MTKATECQLGGCRYLQTTCLTCGRIVCKEALPPLQEWISVKDRLPPQAGMYLVVAEWMGVIVKAEFNGKDRWCVPHLFDPTHWMSLPEMPSG